MSLLQKLKRLPWFEVTIVIALLGFGGVLYEIDDPFDNDFARAYQTAIDGLSLGSK